ncbi:MAG: hypothetical protein JWM10_1941, partial [Myxococcaceae bacterium]|nr:hypothetical protein [Myxococcaceae bacterium]
DQRTASRARREAADRRMADGHFAQFQRNDRATARDSERRAQRRSRLDDGNRRLADRHFAQFQRSERVAGRDRDRQARVDGRNNQSYFQRMSRLRGASSRENDQIRRRDERTQARNATQRQRAEQRRSRTVDREGSQAVGQMFGMGARGVSAVYGGMMSIVSATLSAVAAVVGLAAGFAGLSLMIGGAILQMIAFREGTLMTLSTLMRLPGEERMTPAQRQAARGNAAEGELAWAQQFGRETPLSTQQVVELRTQASTAGYQGAEARTMTAAAADAGALHPNDASTASRFMLQMGQLKNSSVARSADYRPAAQAAGVSETAAMRRAAIAAGVVQRGGENESAYQRRIRTAQGNGGITGRQMHDAILAEQRSQLGSRNSGDFARSQAGSMGAVLSNLGEGVEAFITGIRNIESLPGVVALKNLLTQIADTLAGATNNGKRLQAIAATVISTVAGFVGKTGKGGFDGMLSDALDVAKELLPIVRGVLGAFREGFMEGFGPFITELRQGAGDFMASGGHDLMAWAREFGRGLGILATLMLRVTMLAAQLGVWAVAGVGHLEDLGNAINRVRAGAGSALGGVRVAMDPFAAARRAARDAILPPGSRRRSITDLLGITNESETVDEFHGIGADMADGVSRGFRSRQTAMQSEISAVMASLPATARTDMQIKSPSRVMAEIGEYMALGVTQGLDSGAGGVQSAMSNVVAPPGLPGFGGAGGLGAGGASITIGSVVFQVSGAADAEGLFDALRTKIDELFVGALERAQLAAGA